MLKFYKILQKHYLMVNLSKPRPKVRRSLIFYFANYNISFGLGFLVCQHVHHVCCLVKNILF